MKIYKYPLNVTGKQSVYMPKGAKILSVGTQESIDEEVCLWALVDPDAEPERRTILIYGTGHEIVLSSNMEFIGTTMTHGGRLVWHVWEIE